MTRPEKLKPFNFLNGSLCKCNGLRLPVSVIFSINKLIKKFNVNPANTNIFKNLFFFLVNKPLTIIHAAGYAVIAQFAFDTFRNACTKIIKIIVIEKKAKDAFIKLLKKFFQTITKNIKNRSGPNTKN